MHTTVIVSCADGRTVKATAASDGHSRPLLLTNTLMTTTNLGIEVAF